MVKLDVVEWVGEDFGRPHQARLYVLDDKQLQRSEQYAADAEREPDHGHLTDKAGLVDGRRKQAEIGRIKIKRQWRQCPDRQQNDFAPQIVADFDLFLVFVRGFVHHVVVLRLEEEMPGRHCNEPTCKRRDRWILEDHHVSKKKTRRTDQMKRLVNAAVVIIAVIVPTLGAQGFQKILHAFVLVWGAQGTPMPDGHWAWIWRFDESLVTGQESAGGAYRFGLTCRALFAEADQAEMPDRRHGATLNEMHAGALRGPARISRERKFGAPTELARGRLEPMLERTPQTRLRADAADQHDLAAGL